MTSGAARLVAKLLSDKPSNHPFHEIYRRLISREDNWISSQWMTERPGGSDVQNSETVAIYSPLPRKTGEYGSIEEGEYLVSGFKFFSSATDCNMALMLAKTESGVLSLFVAPTRRSILENGEKRQVTNGIRIHRLKNKMGTKELPTAELELKNVRAWLIGPIDRGIPTIALLLNVTRTHNFITALSCWRRGMSIAKGFSLARTTINQPLWTFPMHLRLLATMEVKHRGLLQLAFYTTALLSFVDNGFPDVASAQTVPFPEPGEEADVVLRTLTASAKAVICKVATMALQECQEAMGGVGYMDEPDEPEHNIARLMRDTAANMTWEGTTNVLASEVTRHLLNRDAGNLKTLSSWLNRLIAGIREAELKRLLGGSWRNLEQVVIKGKDDLSSSLSDARQIMFTLVWIISGTLLAIDAQRDNDEVAIEIARRWVIDGEGGVGEFAFPQIVHSSRPRVSTGGRDRTNWDCKLVWGTDLPENASSGYRPLAARPKL